MFLSHEMAALLPSIQRFAPRGTYWDDWSGSGNDSFGGGGDAPVDTSSDTGTVDTSQTYSGPDSSGDPSTAAGGSNDPSAGSTGSTGSVDSTSGGGGGGGAVDTTGFNPATGLYDWGNPANDAMIQQGLAQSAAYNASPAGTDTRPDYGTGTPYDQWTPQQWATYFNSPEFSNISQAGLFFGDQQPGATSAYGTGSPNYSGVGTGGPTSFANISLTDALNTLLSGGTPTAAGGANAATDPFALMPGTLGAASGSGVGGDLPPGMPGGAQPSGAVTDMGGTGSQVFTLPNIKTGATSTIKANSLQDAEKQAQAAGWWAPSAGTLGAGSMPAGASSGASTGAIQNVANANDQAIQKLLAAINATNEQDFQEKIREYNQTRQDALSQFVVNTQRDLATTAAGLTGPQDYFKFLNFMNGGRNVFSSLFGSQPQAAFGGMSGTTQPLTLQSILDRMGMGNGSSGAQTPAGTPAVSGVLDPNNPMSLPLPNQINPTVWNSLGPVAQSFIKSAYQAAGYDPNVIQQQITNQLPATTSAPTGGSTTFAPTGLQSAFG